MATAALRRPLHSYKLHHVTVTLLVFYCLLAARAHGITSAPSLSFVTRPAAFAAGGGFGGSTAGTSKKNKKKQSKPARKKVGESRSSAAKASNLFTPEGRIEHIKSRIAAADLAPMAKLALTQVPGSDQIALDIDPNAVCVVDDFLGPELIGGLRAEAESIVPTMVPSQSTRWDEETQSVVAYEKHQVLSTQVMGGEAGYAATPRLVEYVATLTQSLAAKLNTILPDSHHLSGSEQTNKLAVCLGDGSHYDKHIDNLGGGDGRGDQRKLTALLYLQQPSSHVGNYPNEHEDEDDRGGYFRAYDVPAPGEVTSIAPKGDRLLLFWSDSLVHDVSPSYAPNGDADRRWALTVWFVVGEGGKIRATDAEIEQRHFGSG